MPSPQSDPHSPECERAILGAILLDPLTLPQVALRLRVEDFYLDRHRCLYQAVLTIQAARKPIDLRTIQVELERTALVERVGGLGYLASLDLDLPDLGHLDTYVQEVHDSAVRRRLVDACQRTILEARGGLPTQEVMDSAIARVRGAQGNSWACEEGQDLADGIESWLDRVSEAGYALPEGPRTNTGIDKYLGSFAPSNLYLVAGDPGTGKTALAVQVLADAIGRGMGTLFFSNDTAPDGIIARLLGHVLRANHRGLSTGRFPHEGMVGSVRLASMMRAAGHKVVARGGVPWRRLRDEAARWKDRTLGKVLMLDHLHQPGLRRSGRSGEGLEVVIGELVEEMAQAAKDLELSLVVLAHLSRKAAQESRQPRASDVKYAGDGPAHGLLLLWRPPIGSGPDGETIRGPKGKIILAKHRDGPEGSVKTIYDGQQSRWSDDPEGG